MMLLAAGGRIELNNGLTRTWVAGDGRRPLSWLHIVGSVASGIGLHPRAGTLRSNEM